MSTPVDNVNNNSNFVRVKWKTAIREVLFSASVEVEEGSLVYPNPSAAWQYTKADSTAWWNFWVVKKTIASTDSDYASTKLVPVEFPTSNDVEWKFTVWAWTFTQADEGKYVDLHNEKSVAVDTTSKLQFFITKYISSTVWNGILAWNLASWQQLPATS
jgi:hypothetical protein